jgi:hypothetical protein
MLEDSVQRKVPLLIPTRDNTAILITLQILYASVSIYASPPYPQGILSKTLSGSLETWVVLNPTFTVFYSYMHAMIKFNLQIRHCKN